MVEGDVRAIAAHDTIETQRRIPFGARPFEGCDALARSPRRLLARARLDMSRDERRHRPSA